MRVSEQIVVGLSIDSRKYLIRENREELVVSRISDHTENTLMVHIRLEKYYNRKQSILY